MEEVEAHQPRHFTSNILDFFKKSDFTFTTTGSVGAQVGKVQAHQTR
jgi:hypothetical protein